MVGLITDVERYGLPSNGACSLRGNSGLHNDIDCKCARTPQIYCNIGSSLAFIYHLLVERDKPAKKSKKEGQTEEQKRSVMVIIGEIMQGKSDVDFGTVIVVIIFLFILYLFAKSQGWVA